MIIPTAFQNIVAALNRADIAHMLSGSFASSVYGAARSTQDIDFVIEASASQLRALIKSLPDNKYYVDLEAALDALARRSLFNVIDLDSGWKIDFIIRKDRDFSREEFLRRKRIDFFETGLFVATAEDVVISKLEWARLAESRRQIEDVAAVLKAQWTGLDRAYVEKWTAELGLVDQWREACRIAGMAL